MRPTNKPKPEILIIASLDTKGELVTYIKNILDINGASACVMDIGLRGVPSIDVDITREQIAKESGKEILLDSNNKNEAMDIISEGARIIAEKMIQSGKIKGIIGIGGCVGTMISCQIMKSMPIGFPKVIVSTIPYDLRTTMVSSDIMFLHSVADVLGLNPITRKVLNSGVGAIMGMINLQEADYLVREKINVGVTALGITTTAADFLYNKLSLKGFEVTVFHANGIGGAAFEEASRDGMFDAIIDLTTHEINHILFDTPVVKKDFRLDYVTTANVPYIFIPGGLDIITQGPLETLRENYKERPHYVHSKAFTHVRVSCDEAREIAIYVAKKINMCKESVGVCIPLRGFSQMNKEGTNIFDKNADNLFIEILKENLESHVVVNEVDAHINDEKFADSVCKMLLSFKLKLIIK